MIEIMRRIEFDAGHRLIGHESKCAYLHGHRYVAEIYISAPETDRIGRVIDFGEVKRVIGGWIDENWDHNMILNPDDPLVQLLFSPHLAINPARALRAMDIWKGKDPFRMPSTYSNPTAENIAAVLFEKCCELLPDELTTTKVTIWETPNCSATFEPERG